MKIAWASAGVVIYILAVLLLTSYPSDGAQCWFGQSFCLSANDVGAFLSGIFAPLAFAWLAWSVMMQSNELALQREELKLTRDEMKESRAVAEGTGIQVKAQADAMKKQTEFFDWQFKEQRMDSKERELTRLLDSLLALMRTSISGNTIVKTMGDNGTQHYSLLDSQNSSAPDGVPSHIALGLMHTQFRIKANYIVESIEQYKPTTVQLFHIDTLRRVHEVLNWIISLEPEIRSAALTDVYSAKIYGYRDILEKLNAIDAKPSLNAADTA